MKPTVTTIFMLPTLKISRDGLRNNGFINAYYRDKDHTCDYENCIYVLFRPDNIYKFRDFLQSEYRRTKNIVEDYDYEKGFVVAVYQLDDRWNEDFEKIKKGKYSKTSDEFQSMFPRRLDIIKDGKRFYDVSLQWRIFNKTDDLKAYWEDKLGVQFDGDMEFWEIWDEEKETLNINKIMKEYEGVKRTDTVVSGEE